MRASLCAALLVVSLCGSDTQSVHFAVAKGTTLRKTFEIGSRFVLEDMKTKVNGELQPSPDLASKNLYAQQERRIVIVDQYVDTADGRPERLRRRYQEISGRKLDRMPLMQPGGKPVEEDLSSDLQGATVRFAWDGEASAFDATIVDGESKVDPSRLHEDMDLRMFLPGRDVSPGESWKVDASHFDEIFTLGGELGLEDDEGTWFEESLAEILEGEIEVAYETLDDSGVATLRIHANLDFDGQIEDRRSGAPMDVAGDVTMKGQLLWDVRGGHFKRFDLGADMDLSMRIEPPDPRAELQIEMASKMNVRISGTAVRA